MFKDYFGDAAGGWLKRGRFVVLWLILIAVFFSFGLAAGAGIGIAEHIVGGDLAEAQKKLRETLALPAIVAVAAFFLLFAFAKLNIFAKRARDTGLPGWVTAIVVAGLIGASSQVTEGVVSGGLGMLVLIVLALVPSNALRRAQ